MDQVLRDALQRTTQQARTLLEGEYSDQLAGIFDIRRNEPIPERPGDHLRDGSQVLVRSRLVETIRHKLAVGRSREQAVDDYIREAAFTTLNRYVALKVLETRGLVQECVSRGDQSSGYKEFTGLASELALLTDGSGYRLYLECLFDEISTGVKALFDRRDPAALLAPRRQALAELLAALNDPTINEAWDQDETIGWVYQYFNSEQERRQMREASNAPRDSHELAVRNQFFTPRYVVEFLSDNTLGRTWYEMRKGQTKLRDQCRYLVRRPNEIFLEKEEAVPAADNCDELSSEESLRQSVYIPHRRRKDPRDLQILDPACGSGHFLLYCFSLLLVIYEEAWADVHSPASEVSGRTLRDDYPTLDALRRELPGLILRFNLWGVDIDPRCAQIAAFALWLRAQRAYSDFQIARVERPIVRRTNIVVAEPMPGENDMLEEFCKSLEPKVLGRLVLQVFDRMKLAGTAGTLLWIEEEIRETVETVKKDWNRGPKFTQRKLFGQTPSPMAQETFLDQYDGTDAQFWDDAEDRIDLALREFATKAANGDVFRRKLFTDDAEGGFAFIEVCRTRYDVILMNPPFGALPAQGKSYLDARYPQCAHDMYPSFVIRCLGLLKVSGLLGVLSNRTCLLLPKLHAWRRHCLLDTNHLVLLADLGHGVLDEAMVEAAAYCIQASAGAPGAPTLFFSMLHVPNEKRASRLAVAVANVCEGVVNNRDFFARHLSMFKAVPGLPIAYAYPAQMFALYTTLKPVESDERVVRVTNQTSDDFRFFRLWWEVPELESRDGRSWVPFTKGGDYAPYYSDLSLVIDWNDKYETYNGYVGTSHRTTLFPASSKYFFKEGLTYTLRTNSGFAPRILPGQAIFGNRGPAIIVPSRHDAYTLLGVAMSRPFQAFVEMRVASADATSAGTPSRAYEVGLVQRVPIPPLDSPALRGVADKVRSIVLWLRALDAQTETSHAFTSFFGACDDTSDVESLTDQLMVRRFMTIETVLSLSQDVERAVRSAYGLSDTAYEQITALVGKHPYDYPFIPCAAASEVLASAMEIKLERLVQQTVGQQDGHRSITVKAYYIDRHIEVMAHIHQISARSVLEVTRLSRVERPVEQLATAVSILSYAFGCVFGRWDLKGMPMHGTGSDCSDPLDALPTVALGRRHEQKQCAESLSHGTDEVAKWDIVVDDPGHRRDVMSGIQRILTAVWKESADRAVRQLAAIVEPLTSDMRVWWRRMFFTEHVKRYSGSHRKAPIYWQIATQSGKYSIWLYYQHLTRDSLYKVLNDYLKPKIQHEERNLDSLRREADENLSARERGRIEEQEQEVAELRALREECERVAPIWNPNLNDGVLINFAPLWRMVPQHRAWQRECKECWDKLVAGEYDWSALAMHLWPERVIPKCRIDASLAIAHDLENEFWNLQAPSNDGQPVQDAGLLVDGEREADETEDNDESTGRQKRRAGSSPRWCPREDVTEDHVASLIAERTSPAVKHALEQLLAAPTAIARRHRGVSDRNLRARRSPLVHVPATGTRIDLIQQVRKALGSNGDGIGKNVLVQVTGLTADQVDAAIQKLIEVGEAEKAGTGRGTRYRLARGVVH